MASAGGHWVKGSFIPAESGAGGELPDNQYVFLNPSSLDDIKRWARERSSASNDDVDVLVSFNLDQRELAAGVVGGSTRGHVGMIAEGKELSLGDAYAYLDRSVRGVLDNRDGAVYFDLNYAGVAPNIEAGQRRLDESQRGRAIDNVYKAIDRLARVDGFEGRTVKITEEGSPTYPRPVMTTSV